MLMLLLFLTLQRHNTAHTVRTRTHCGQIGDLLSILASIFLSKIIDMFKMKMKMIRFVLTKHTGTEVEHKIMGQTRMNEEEKNRRKENRESIWYIISTKKSWFSMGFLYFSFVECTSFCWVLVVVELNLVFFSFSVVEMKMGMKIATAIATTATIKHIPLSIWINSISVYENSNPKKGNYLFSQRRYMLTQIYI